ncbi:hypothetical protein H8356DRAFT_1286734 [Neocallimastix lanati (nom. inval.)]|nr:hypothetical protein H8356DRAFT_1286734 [Neocallimastix sp. JGI-2020a]
MFIRTAAVYISLILSVLVTLLLIQEYIPSNLHIIINSNLSIFKYKLLNIYDKLFNIEKEYEISVEFSTKESNNTKISRLIEYLPLQNNEYINYYENDNEENDICLIDHSKPTIQFTIKEKNLSLKKRILKERKENNIAKDKFFNKYMDLKIHGTDKYKTPPMERKMDGEKEYVEMNLKGKLRYVGTNFTTDILEKPEKLYIDDITNRRVGAPDTIKVTRQPSQGEGYWLKKIRIIGVNDNERDEEIKKNNIENGNLNDVCTIDEAIVIFGGSKIVTTVPCTKENDYEYCESVGYISGSIGEKITWYYAEVIDSDMKYANPKAHELSLKLCKQKSSNPDTCSVWGSMLNGCGVIASSPTGTFSVGYAMNFMKAVNANLNQVFATQNAMKSCEKNDSSKGLCHVSWIKCTTTSYREPKRFI